MAFLVCYSWSPPDDHARHPAIYLDQRFYELIYAICRSESGQYTLLREIALLQYKSPILVIEGESINELDQDLVRLSESGVSHEQMLGFHEVVRRAMSDGCAITVSGDMYPELGRTSA
jgi:hypothetical protein